MEISVETSAAKARPKPPVNRAKERESISWSEHFYPGAWLLSDYADVAAALRDPRFSVRRTSRWVNSSIDPGVQDAVRRNHEKAKLREFKRILARSLLFVDGHSHTRLRRVMHAGFSAASLQRQAPRIAAIVDGLIRQILAKAACNAAGESIVAFDFIADFARPLPVLVIADLLGVDLQGPDMQTDFVAAATAIAAFIGSPAPTMEQALAAQDALTGMLDYFHDVIAQRRMQPQPGDDLVGQLIRAADSGKISATELLAQCCTLLFAGYETTRHLLGNGLLALLQHQDQWRALQKSQQNERDKLPGALRELLRYDSPVQYTGRRLIADVEMHGRQLRKGALVILRIAAANRDPRRFTNPDQLDIDRDEGNHLSFGYGPHVCIGATLTYMEAEIAFRALMRALPCLQLQAGGLRWQNNAAYHGLEALPLTCVVPTSQETPHG
jgi:cytochrome P450